ncbi:VOC family protein [Thalassospiraceae bacterium LMO-JJ14]|nr:VOC family protein [Thalassospiraceae bacterium LMO-JJ14]
MAKKVAPVPKGYRTITPYLVVRGADAALAYYADVFGAEVLSRVYAEDGVTVLHAEMKIGNSMVIVSDEMPAFGIYSPFAYGGSGATQHLYLANVDEIWEKAVEAGCTVLVPLADTFYGERFAKVVDPFGHIWSMSKRIPAQKPEDIKAQTQAEGFSIYEPVGNREDQPYPTADADVSGKTEAA